MLNLKAKLYAAGAAVLAFIGLLLRIFYLNTAKEKAERQAKVYKGRAEQAKKVQELDADIEEQSDIRLAQAKKEMDDGEVPHNFGSDRNNW